MIAVKFEIQKMVNMSICITKLTEVLQKGMFFYTKIEKKTH